MIEQLLRDKIQEYGPLNTLEQENVLQELMQQLVLASLAKTGLFTEAIFHGGTCLRLLFGTRRFSEDLDFLLKRPDPAFRWERHLAPLVGDLAQEGIRLELVDRSAADATVKKAFLKTDSIGTLLLVDLPHSRRVGKKIRIKLEVDTNPPEGSTFETRYLAFPRVAAITTQTLESGFATKSHALLCRGYAKGRDWYDLLWYVARRAAPDLNLLRNALLQQGPWAGEPVQITPVWFVDALRARIDEIDWEEARADVARFVPASEQEGLDLWSRELFLFQVEQLAGYL